MRYLLATDSVHTTAAACDYLQDRVGPDDAVLALHVVTDDSDALDGQEALNVATVRLATVDVETEQRSGESGRGATGGGRRAGGRRDRAGRPRER